MKQAIFRFTRIAVTAGLILIAADVGVWFVMKRPIPIPAVPRLIQSRLESILEFFARHGIPREELNDVATFVVCPDLADELGPAGIAELNRRINPLQYLAVSEEQAPQDWINATGDVAAPGYASLCSQIEWQFTVIAVVEVTEWRSGLAASGQSRITLFLFGYWIAGPSVGGWMA